MNINDLIAIVKKKLINEIKIEKIEVEDKSFYIKIIQVIKRESFI